MFFAFRKNAILTRKNMKFTELNIVFMIQISCRPEISAAGGPRGVAGRPPGPRDQIFGKKTMFSSGFTGVHRVTCRVPKFIKIDVFYHLSRCRETGTKHCFLRWKKGPKSGQNLGKFFAKIDNFSSKKTMFSSVNFVCTQFAFFIIFYLSRHHFLPRFGPLQPEQK